MHVSPTGLLRAHSVAETFLFVSVTNCPKCQRRPVRAAGELTVATASPPEWRLTIDCAGCGQASDLQFAIDPPPSSKATPVQINPTKEPSHLIDPAGWLALFRVIAEGAARETNRTEARAMGLEAAQCIDEALRFYPPGESRPPATAFYSESSAQRFRDHPEQFERAHLLSLRGKLPVAATMSTASAPRRKWWKPW